MFKVNNIKISSKIMLILIVPLIGLIVTSTFAIINMRQTTNEITAKIYNIAHQSDYWLLNADRDYYQALVAQMDMNDAVNANDLKISKDAYLENTQQTTERVKLAMDILSKDKATLENYKHEDSKLTVFQLFDQFNKDYSDWSRKFNPNTNVLTGNRSDYLKSFDSARNSINQIEEILDVYSNDMIAKAKKLATTTEYLVIVFAMASILISLLFGILIIINIRMRTKKTVDLIKKTADFDLSADTKYSDDFEEKDEFGTIIKAEEKARTEFRNIIKMVVSETLKLEQIINLVNRNMAYLNEQIEDISTTTEELSAGMEETAASSQEMNATSIEISKSAENIALNAQEGAKSANQIGLRATQLQTSFLSSQENALKIFDAVKVKLEKALSESKAVEQINTLTDAILEITDQTNLLALNAAIEASRAGEAGRGFAIVADEIRKLAESSKKTANEIQNKTKVVISSVNNLSRNSDELLKFVEADVQNDYKSMLQATGQYSKDAEYMGGLINDFSSTSKELLTSLESILKAINEVTISTGEGASSTSTIAEKSSTIVDTANDMLSSINSTREGAAVLNQMVSKFKVS